MKLIYKVGIGLTLIGGGYIAYNKLYKRMITDKGLTFLTLLEGFKNKMYRDSKGLPTIGVGHLILPTEKHLLTKTLSTPEIKTLLNTDLDRFEKIVKDSIKVPINAHQKDALVAIAFNIGKEGFRTSSLVKKINAKAPPSEIIKGFSAWSKPAVLKERRAKEARLFLTGNYSNVITPSEFNQYFNG